jgi:DNA polymerase-3 subunit beta
VQEFGFESEGKLMPIVEKPAAQGAAMEITVSRQDLVKELTATQSVVERKTTIPILSNFLIEAEGDRLNITATDLDQAIRTSAEAKVKKPGACTIPARKLYDYVKLLPEGDISIKPAGQTRRWWAWRAPTTLRSRSSLP